MKIPKPMPAGGVFLKGTRKAGRNMTRRAKKVVKITKTVPVRPMKDTTKAQVTSVVRNLINRRLENRFIGWKTEDEVQHNSPISSADCYPIVQQIAPGDTAQGRQGDRITPKSLTVKGVVSFNPDDCTTSQNIYVRVVIAQQKNIRVGSAVTGGVDAGRLLRPGFAGADTQGFTGNTGDLNMPINRDLFRVYMDKTFKLASGVVTGGSVETQPLYSRRWSYRFKSLPSSLTFDDGNGDWANNFAPFIAVGYAYSDGSGPDTVATRIVSTTTSFLSYEDA